MTSRVLALGVLAWVSNPLSSAAQGSLETPSASAAVESESNATEPTPNHGVVEAERVDLVVIGSQQQLERVRGVVAAWRLGQRTLNWQRAERFEPRALFEPGVAEPAMRCWVDLTQGAVVRLYFANGRTQRFLARSLETSGNLDELDREALGQAIELSLLALLEDRAAGLSRKDAESLFDPEPEKPPPAPPRAPERKVLQVETNLGYSVALLIDTLPVVHGPGLDVVVASSSELRFAGFLDVHYRLPATWEDPLGQLRLQATALRIGAEVAPRLYESRSPDREGDLRLAVRVGAGLDVSRFEPRRGSDTPNAVTTAPRSRIEPILTTSAQLLVLLPASLSLRVGPLLDLAPEQVHYDAIVDARRTPVFHTMRFRPGASVAAGATW